MEQYWKLLISDEDGEIRGAYYVGDNWDPELDTIVYLSPGYFV